MNKASESTYLTGTTIRFIGEFRDFDGNLIDITFPKVTIYNQRYTVMEEHQLNDSNKLETGKYFFDYVSDEKAQRIIYEFYGEIDGSPALDRKSFVTRFI